jgi:hypothetical protein
LVFGAIKDVGKIVKGIFTMVCNGISKDNINLSLSSFSTPSHFAKVGYKNYYELDICNIAKQGVWVNLRIAIFLEEESDYPDEYYYLFSKAIFVGPRKNQHVNIVYDWKDYAIMGIGSNFFKSNISQSRNYCSEDEYFIKAMLLDQKDKVFDELTIVQSLSG